MKSFNLFRSATPALLIALISAAALSGCGRGPSISEIEERERTSRLFSNAMDDLQAGRTDAAIKGFTRVVYQEPQSYSAHFQLATLLQDVKKDYIGAIAHYRAYLDLRPASEKANVAEDRMKSCHALLSAEYLRKANDSGSQSIVSEISKLKSQNKTLSENLAQTTAALNAATKKIAALESEAAMRKRIIDKLDLDESGAPSKKQSAKDALAELRAMEDEDRRRRINPTDAELLEEDDAPRASISDSPEFKRLKSQLAEEEKKTANTPFQTSASTPKPDRRGSTSFDALLGRQDPKSASARPETYVVQEGDTLHKISRRFYGSSRKWREIQSLNRAIIPHDGSLKAGQTIRLPR